MSSLDRALGLMGVSEAAPIVAQDMKKERIEKVLSKKELEALAEKKKQEKKAKKAAEMLAATAQASAKKVKPVKEKKVEPADAPPKVSKAKAAHQATAAKKAAAFEEAFVEAVVPELPMPEHVVSYRARTVPEVLADAETEAARLAAEEREQELAADMVAVKQHIAKGACKLTMEEYELLRCALGDM